MANNYSNEFKLGLDGLILTVGQPASFEVPEGVLTDATVKVAYSDTSGFPQSVDAAYEKNGNIWSFIVPVNFDISAQSVMVSISQSRNFGDDPGTVSATAVIKAYDAAPTATVTRTAANETKFEFGIPAGKAGDKGDKGDKGDNGTDGKSAYEIALDAGYKGSHLDWLNSLKGQKGDVGNQGKSAYQVAFDAGFSGTEAEWLESLKAPANPVGGGYKELANGTLWYCRPRFETRRCVIPDTGFGAYDYETAYYTEKFIIEDSLFEDHGCYVVPQDSNIPQDRLRLRTTRGVNRGVHKAGRYTNESGNTAPYSSTPGMFVDKWAEDFKGWYYVMLSPAESAQFLTDVDLEKIEVDVQPVTFSGVNITDWAVGGMTTYHLAKEQGLLTPIYKGASRHVIHATGETVVALWFRVGVYTHRSNIGADNHSFDGINGEPNGWNLHDVDVKFWSTNVAQGMKFSAKVRR
jgi:hypothetical protein